MREIVLDTETTGLSPDNGHKIIEIGCVELLDYSPTGNEFQVYINPAIEIPEQSIKIHGITNKDVRDKPKFEGVVDGFLEFIGDSPIVAHNAQFDIRFINSELKEIDRLPIKNPVIDTLEVARKKFPGASLSLNALCKMFNISTEERVFHGALLDTKLLARVYLEMVGKKQFSLQLKVDPYTDYKGIEVTKKVSAKHRSFPISDEEHKKHKELVEEVGLSLWKKILEIK